MRARFSLSLTVLLAACGPVPVVEVDAGQQGDASVLLDAGASDGGSIDSDGGASDGSVTDAGAPDGSTIDSGAQDAGAADASVTDAGAVDAGAAVDAGPITTPIDQWAWVPVPGSECAKGSMAGLGVNRSAQTDDLFIFVQGGGACWNQGTCVPSLLSFGPVCDYGGVCLYNGAGGQQPTAVHVNENDPYPQDGGGAAASELNGLKTSKVFDRADSTNPFRNATYVFVPYCTGDLHDGRAQRTYQYKVNLFDQPSNFVMRFSGAANMEAYIARLKATLPNVRRIWLTGASGGAYGASLNYDRFSRAFPNAEVHLLSDSGPFIQPTAHWPEWRDVWNMEMPQGCADCDAGFPQIMNHLGTAYPNRRLGLLSYDRDPIIAWFALGGQGLNNYLNPPIAQFTAALTQLEDAYDTKANMGYFVIAGQEHVLFQHYGTLQADGGYSAPIRSRDGGTDLRQWVNAWATGTNWRSTR